MLVSLDHDWAVPWHTVAMCRVVAAVAVELPGLGALWGQRVEGSCVQCWRGVLC